MTRVRLLGIRLLAAIAFVALVLALNAQTIPVSVPATAPSINLTPSGVPGDVWFWVFVGWYVFSALVSGMPEPTPESTPWYIWAYRSFHILAASGTSFFQNKMFWKTEDQVKRDNTR